LKELRAISIEAVGSGMRAYLSDFGNLISLAGVLPLIFFDFQNAKATWQIVTTFVEQV